MYTNIILPGLTGFFRVIIIAPIVFKGMKIHLEKPENLKALKR
jgi:hypothetical protein